jgi:hypothetical protein
MMHQIVSITFPGAPTAKWLQVLHLIWVANSTGGSGRFNQRDCKKEPCKGTDGQLFCKIGYTPCKTAQIVQVA